MKVAKLLWLKYCKPLLWSVKNTNCLWLRLGFHVGIELFLQMVVVQKRAAPALMVVAWDKFACQQLMLPFMLLMHTCGDSGRLA